MAAAGRGIAAEGTEGKEVERAKSHSPRLMGTTPHTWRSRSWFLFCRLLESMLPTVLHSSESLNNFARKEAGWCTVAAEKTEAWAGSVRVVVAAHEVEGTAAWEAVTDGNIHDLRCIEHKLPLCRSCCYTKEHKHETPPLRRAHGLCSHAPHHRSGNHCCHR